VAVLFSLRGLQFIVVVFDKVLRQSLVQGTPAASPAAVATIESKPHEAAENTRSHLQRHVKSELHPLLFT
jgi:hypothetical protein